MKSSNLKEKAGKLSISSVIGIFSLSFLAVSCAVYLYSPVFRGNAKESSGSDVNVNIGEVMSLALDSDELNLDANINSFVSGDITATASTNSQYGYTLTLEDADDNSSLVHANSNVSDTVASEFTGKKTSSEMDNNTWGFSLNSTDYYRIPVFGSPVALKRVITPMSTLSEATTVDFGVKVGRLASGTYADTVLLTIYTNGPDGDPNGPDVTNPGEVANSCGRKTLHDITNMQEMTPCVCSNTTTPKVASTIFDWDGSHHDDTDYVPRKKLIDSRDGKGYLVSKLADGKCWMSQNLDMDLVYGQEIEVSNNDGTVSMATPDTSTITTTGIAWARSENVWRSYRAPADGSYYRGGTEKSSTPTAPGDEYLWESTGVAYNWYAATAGTGQWFSTHSSDVNEDAVSSICPKGWRLPSGTVSGPDMLDYDETDPNSVAKYVPLAYLLDHYTYDVIGPYTGTSMITSNPLNLVIAGGYHYSGVAAYVGQAAMYWTATPYTQYLVHSLNIFNSQSYRPQLSNIDMGSGFSVRCVAIYR